MSNNGLPSDLNFSLKKAAPRGIRQFRTSLNPIGGISTSGAVGGDVLKFDIPTGRRGQYIDTTSSYLQIKVKAPGGKGDITLDGSAYCFFQRLTVLSGGQILEDINEYANFVNLQLDAGVGPVVRQTSGNIMMGTNCDALNISNVMRSGQTLPSLFAGATDYNAVFTLPLVSGILGAQGSTKYLPVGAIQNDLRLEIQLHQANNAVINTNTTALITSPWSIVEANFIISFIELDSDVQQMIDSQTGGNYQISSESWRSYTNSIGNGSTGDSVLIPARFSSVKGILHTFRPQAQNSYLLASQSHRYNPFFSADTTKSCNVQYTIGPTLYPNSAIRSSSEAFAELQRYFHNLGNSNINGSINFTNYNIIAPATVLAVGGASQAAAVANHFTNCGAGVFGINLDNVANRSDVMTSGLNTLNSNIILNMTYATAIPEACRFDSYVHVDMLMVIENGILSVRV